MTRPFLIAAGLLVAGAAGAAPTAPAPAAPLPFATLEKAKTVQVTETIQAASDAAPLTTEAILTVTLSRPGQVHLEQNRPGVKTPDLILVSDGTAITQYSAAKNQYQKEDGPPHDLGTAGIPALQDLSGAEVSVSTLDGKPAQLYKVVHTAGEQTVTVKVWIDPKTHLPEQQSLLLGVGAQAKERQRVVFSDWALDKTVAPSVFAFTPPTGATEYKQPQLLAKGTAAPDFTVQDPTGKPVKLSDYKGKVVVIDFWATWCGPCQQSLPHTNQVAEQFKDKNVVFLGVNVWDKKDAFDAWLPQHKDFDAISFVIDPSPNGKDVASSLYNVTGIPTQYIIDTQGNIVQSIVGYDGPSDDLANAIKTAGAS